LYYKLKVNQKSWKNVGLGESKLKFKAEIGLLLMAIVLFAVSVFFYSYQVIGEGLSFAASLGSYPYRGIAITFVGFGSVLTLAASISYSKRSKNLGNTHRRV
jgi:hypothetical protein